MTRELMWDRLWIGCNLATMATEAGSFGEIQDGAIGCKGGRIVWVGRESELPGPAQKLSKRTSGSINPSGAARAASFRQLLIRVITHLPSSLRIRRFDATFSTRPFP